MFDLLVWLFGRPLRYGVHLHEPRRMAGCLDLEQADVVWFLSVDSRDLPISQHKTGSPSLRSIAIDGSEIDFSAGFSDLHMRVYKRTLAGDGFGIDDARCSIELAYRLRHAAIESRRGCCHPFLRR
jgi:UDP-N-acetyl-2-amino-2-deoxyglucuronate dehydrogenase